MAEKNNSDNIVSIAEARKRQKVLRKGANGADHGKEKHPKKNGPGNKIWAYIQFFLFLGVLAYFMQKCRGG